MPNITIDGQSIEARPEDTILQAAKRAGIRRVVLPEPNRRDVAEISPELLKGLELEYVGTIDEALAHTLAAPSSTA